MEQHNASTLSGSAAVNRRRGFYARNARGERRLSPTWYKVLLTTHIIFAVGWLGVAIARVALELGAAASHAPATAAALYFASQQLTLPPLPLGTLVTGLALSLGTRWGVFQHLWVVAKLALTVGVVTATGLTATRITRPADVTATGWTVASGTILGLHASPAALLLVAALAQLLMLGGATIIAVNKPWGKTWFGRRATMRTAREGAILPAGNQAGQAHSGGRDGDTTA